MPNEKRMPVIDLDPKPSAVRGAPTPEPHGLCEFRIQANRREAARLGRLFKSLVAFGPLPAGARYMVRQQGQGKPSCFVAVLPLSHLGAFLDGYQDRR